MNFFKLLMTLYKTSQNRCTNFIKSKKTADKLGPYLIVRHKYVAFSLCSCS